MAGLSDMEELIATVSDRDVADYLREALACYGTGAYRACIVLSHTALFDGLRRKLKALAPVNSVAKSVSDEIEPLADSQQVFESRLIDKMRVSSIITMLESQILEQLNKHRNKAAHPSGHTVTAEEARYVFSEVIQKFLSQPIRETSYVVDRIIAKIADPNFFPTSMMPDMMAVVDQETESLDVSGLPFLLTKLGDTLSGADPKAASNAVNFLLALAAKRGTESRALIAKKIVEPKSSVDASAEFLSMLVYCDPELIRVSGAGTQIRVLSLLQKNAVLNPPDVTPFIQLRNPAHILGVCLRELGEPFVQANMKEFVDFVIARIPYVPAFIEMTRLHPITFAAVFTKLRDNAGSSTFDTANKFAGSIRSLDDPLAAWLSDEQAFELIAAIVRAADWGAFSSQYQANLAFAEAPKLKAKAQAFAIHNAPAAAASPVVLGMTGGLAAFVAKYLV